MYACPYGMYWLPSCALVVRSYCNVIVTVQFVVEFLIARYSEGGKWRTIARWRRGELIFVYLFPCTHFENKCCSIKLCLYCWACLFCCELLGIVEERRTASCMTTIPGSAFFMHLPERTRHVRRLLFESNISSAIFWNITDRYLLYSARNVKRQHISYWFRTILFPLSNETWNIRNYSVNMLIFHLPLC